jgi:hypothetical protein
VFLFIINALNVFSLYFSSDFFKVSFSPEVEVVGSRSLSQKVGSMVKKAEVIYNSNKKSLKSPVQTPSISRVHVFPSNSSIEPQCGAMLSDFKVRNSSTAGKVPIHGPRRPVAPSHYLSDDFVTQNNKWHVSKSEIENYKAICTLANSSKSRLVKLFLILSLFSLLFIEFYY